MPDSLADMAKAALKKSGKLTFDPAAFTAGYLAGVRDAKEVVVKALEKYTAKEEKK